MKKKILSFMIAFCMVLPLAFALSACGPKEEDKTLYVATAEELKTKITEAQDGDVIALTEDVDVTEQLLVTKNITLNLNGKKINYTGGTNLASGVVAVKRGATLTINDKNNQGGIYGNEHAYGAIALTVTGEDDATVPAKLVVNGGNFKAEYYAIVGNGNRHNTEITIHGGKFSANNAESSVAIFNPQDGKLTINGGEFTGIDSAVELRSGTLEVNGGTFKATATGYTYKSNGNGNTTVGAAIAISQHNTNKAINVTINNGNFEGVCAVSVIDTVHPTTHNETMKVTIKGGTFEGKAGFDSHAVYASNGTVTIEGGNFDGKTNASSETNTTILKHGVGEIVAIGGTYNDESVSSYLEEGYHLQNGTVIHVA